MIYTVTMNPAIDYVVRLDAPLTPGAINRSAEEAYQFGGKGINVSTVLRELGHETVALGFVAGETGAWLERGLAASGLKSRFIRADSGMTRINVKIKAGQETEVNGSGPAITAADLERLLEQLDALVSGDVLVLSGSVPGSLGPDVYGRILDRLAGRGILTVVDAAGELLRQSLKYRPFLIKPNREELSAVLGRPLKSEADLEAAARELQAMGAVNVLVSLAGDGGLLLDETGAAHRMRCPQGTVINSVGAGDSMAAGFLAGWLETGDWDTALAWGLAAGSATAFSLGLANREQVEALARELLPMRDYEIACTYLNGCSGAAHPLTDFEEASLKLPADYLQAKHGPDFRHFVKTLRPGHRTVYTWDTGSVTYIYEFTRI